MSLASFPKSSLNLRVKNERRLFFLAHKLSNTSLTKCSVQPNVEIFCIDQGIISKAKLLFQIPGNGAKICCLVILGVGVIILLQSMHRDLLKYVH